MRRAKSHFNIKRDLPTDHKDPPKTGKAFTKVGTSRDSTDSSITEILNLQKQLKEEESTKRAMESTLDSLTKQLEAAEAERDRWKDKYESSTRFVESDFLSRTSLQSTNQT